MAIQELLIRQAASCTCAPGTITSLVRYSAIAKALWLEHNRNRQIVQRAGPLHHLLWNPQDGRCERLIAEVDTLITKLTRNLAQGSRGPSQPGTDQDQHWMFEPEV